MDILISVSLQEGQVYFKLIEEYFENNLSRLGLGGAGAGAGAGAGERGGAMINSVIGQ